MNVIDRLIAADQANRVRIAVLGCSIEDIYVHGDVLPSQDGVMKSVERRRASCPGGAAGAARQLVHWNAQTLLISLIPYVTDIRQEPWQQLDYQLGLDCRRMPTKTRFLDPEGRIVFRHDDERGYGLDANGMAEARRLALSALREMRFDAVLISDYDKGFVDDAVIRQAIEVCRVKGIPVVADAKREPAIYAGAILKCNEEYSHSRLWLQSKHGDALVCSHGPKSPFVGTKGYLDERPAVLCRNHVGAGDAFAAHLTLALAHGLSLEDAAGVAHSAGRVYVQHPHGRPPWPHEVRRDMGPVGGKIIGPREVGIKDNPLWGAEGNVHSPLRHSLDGKRLVFTNGCYDLFGPHHAYCLLKAREAGDCLVVAINDDGSVRRLKGPGRPVVPLEQRMTVLAALECVDWVVPFGEDSPVELLKALRPDVRVKADFPDLNHVGDEYAKEVLLIPPMPGWSTTETCAKISGTGIGS